jgi:hypothetical protein
VTKKLNEGFTTTQVAVTTSAAIAAPAAAGRDTVTLYNSGAATAYVGNSSAVTTTTGFPVPAGASLTMEATVDVYAIGASATTLAVISEG